MPQVFCLFLLSHIENPLQYTFFTVAGGYLVRRWKNCVSEGTGPYAMLAVCFSSPLFPCILDGNDDAAVSWSRVRLSVVHTRGRNSSAAADSGALGVDANRWRLQGFNESLTPTELTSKWLVETLESTPIAVNSEAPKICRFSIEVEKRNGKGDFGSVALWPL